MTKQKGYCTHGNQSGECKPCARQNRIDGAAQAQSSAKKQKFKLKRHTQLPKRKENARFS